MSMGKIVIPKTSASITILWDQLEANRKTEREVISRDENHMDIEVFGYLSVS
jgi:hypothetical protein